VSSVRKKENREASSHRKRGKREKRPKEKENERQAVRQEDKRRQRNFSLPLSLSPRHSLTPFPGNDITNVIFHDAPPNAPAEVAPPYNPDAIVSAVTRNE
jgi:hypothetical protein